MTNRSGNILIVDDSALSRGKLSAAVEALGHVAQTVDNGTDALALLDRDTTDLVLLDIVMPEMNGFDVLTEMANRKLNDIPVLVISAVEDMPEIVEAITLGATDFLPKAVHPSLLQARINTSLEKKWRRDDELSYLQDVHRLTDAARLMREDKFRPDMEALRIVSERSDHLGNLARVFSDMASEIHRREVAFRRQIDLLRGGFLLILIGLIWGMVPAVSKIVMAETPNPVGMAAWVALTTSVVLIVVNLIRGKLKRPTKNQMVFALVMGFLGGVIPQVLLLTAAKSVDAVTLSIILATEALMVFSMAAILRIEPTSPSRFLGLAFGLAGVLLIIVPSANGSLFGGASIWIFVALCVPFMYGMENIALLGLSTDDADPIQAGMLVMIGSLAWSVVLLIALGGAIPPGDLTLEIAFGFLSIAALSLTATLLLILAVARTGAVFTGQSAYFIAFFGIIWGMVLLGEKPSGLIWYSIACISVGLVLVRPSETSELVDGTT